MVYAFSKRAVDMAAALAGLVIAAPVLAVIALLIKRDSAGPVFYRAERVGLGGRSFRMFKFRTMVVDADRKGGPSTADGDPRVTRIGATLRRWKLDELPQLFNVLMGDMSLVGPRPEVRLYTDMFTPGERAILDVKPGVTDFATLWNPNEGRALEGAEDPERVYLERIRPEKIRLQLKYVKERSFLTDLSIISWTVVAIIRRRRPYWDVAGEEDAVTVALRPVVVPHDAADPKG